MSKKVWFLIIFALILLYCLVGYTAIPFKGIVSIVIILLIAVATSFAVRKK